MEMSTLKLVLSLALLTITTASCVGTDLPADFPVNPAVDLCTPAIVKDVFDKDGHKLDLPQVVFDSKGRPFSLIASYAICERTDSKVVSSKPISNILIGVNRTDYDKAQSYRHQVEAYVTANCHK